MNLQINCRIEKNLKIEHFIKFIEYPYFEINQQNFYCLIFSNMSLDLTFQKNIYSAHQMSCCSYIYLHNFYFFMWILCFSFLGLLHLLLFFLFFLLFFTICLLKYFFSDEIFVFYSFLQVFFCFIIQTLLVSINFHMLIIHYYFHISLYFILFLINFLFVVKIMISQILIF